MTSEKVEEWPFETIVVATADLQGRLFGRRVPAARFASIRETGVVTSTCALGWDIEQAIGMKTDLTGFHTGWNDLALIPETDVRNLPTVPSTGIAFAYAYDTQTSKKIDVAPRNVLIKQVELLERAGFTASIGLELEFFLYDNPDNRARQDGYHTVKPTTAYRAQDVIDHETNKQDEIVSKARAALKQAGCNVLLSSTEWGRGQCEINLAHDNPIIAADQVLLMKMIVKDVATAHQKLATFMAKPFDSDVGSSCHINLSLSSPETQNAFFDPDRDRRMSDCMRHSIAGIFKYCPDAMIWIAPNINSYKRTNSTSFAGCGDTWGFDNRTVTCRIVGGTPADMRIEFRLPGADANPYLSIAATLAAVRRGVVEKLDLIEETEGNAYDKETPRIFPRSLDQSAIRFLDSEFAHEEFGSNVVKHYHSHAMFEHGVFAECVTEWERSRYIERV